MLLICAARPSCSVGRLGVERLPSSAVVSMTSAMRAASGGALVFEVLNVFGGGLLAWRGPRGPETPGELVAGRGQVRRVERLDRVDRGVDVRRNRDERQLADFRLDQ